MPQLDQNAIKIFSGRASRQMTQDICKHMGIPLGKASTEMFPDGELLVKLEEDVRGRDCFIVQSTGHPVNANLMEMLIFIDCLKRASAKRITAVLPYFGYARQDRKDEGRVPITAKLVANMITSAGADRVLCMDLHAEQIQGFFDIPVDHLHAAPVITKHLKKIKENLGDVCLVSPDVGNVKTANKYASWLGTDLAIVDKRRMSGTEVVSNNVIGDVKGKSVIMVDDMISTAGTMCEAAKLVKSKGAKKIVAACSHAVMVGLAFERLAQSPIDEIIITDTIHNDGRCDPIKDKLVELTVAPLLGDAISNIHNNKSISSLFNF